MPTTLARHFDRLLEDSVVRAVVLTPLPYPRPERLVMIWETEPGFWQTPLSGPNFLDWQRTARSFDALAAVSARSYSLAGGAEPGSSPSSSWLFS